VEAGVAEVKDGITDADKSRVALENILKQIKDCYRRLRTDPSHRYKWTHPKVASFDFAEIGAPV